MAWLKAQDENALYISAITIGEIARGISLQEKKNPDFARALAVWLEDTVSLYEDRIMPFGHEEARIWGELSARIGHSGADLMIAATALRREATVVTRNVTDFAPTGVALHDPFQSP